MPFEAFDQGGGHRFAEVDDQEVLGRRLRIHGGGGIVHEFQMPPGTRPAEHQERVVTWRAVRRMLVQNVETQTRDPELFRRAQIT